MVHADLGIPDFCAPAPFYMVQGVQPWANLSFAAAAVAIAVITGMELMVMRTTSVEQMATRLRWAHLPLLVFCGAIY